MRSAWIAILLVLLASVPRGVAAEDTSAPASKITALEARLAGAEAELKRIAGLATTAPSASTDRVAALEQRMTGAEAQLTALTGIKRAPSSHPAADRISALEERMTGIEAQLKILSGYKPPTPSEAPPAGLGSPSADAAASDPHLSAAREHAGYCRWREAKAECAAWRKEHEKTGRPTDDVKAIEDAIRSEETDVRLGYLYLTRLTRREEADAIAWDVRFASRPKTAGSFRVNFYVTTDSRILRMTSRFYQDLLRGEHLLQFSWEKAWTAAEGSPVAARVELCYAGHAVDALSEGKAQSVDWWKRQPVGSLTVINTKGHIATDGLVAGEPGTTTFWIVSGDVETWTLDTVRQTFQRLDNRPERPGLEGTDVLPDELKAAPLSKPHAGYVSPVTSSKPSGPDPSKKK